MRVKRNVLVVLIVLALLLILLLALLYPQIGKSAIEKSIYAFLAEDGYTESELAGVEVRHSYISGFLGYGQWHTSIYFADEPQVEYHCVLSNELLPKPTAITAGGFSADLPENYEPLHYPSQ